MPTEHVFANQLLFLTCCYLSVDSLWNANDDGNGGDDDVMVMADGMHQT